MGGTLLACLKANICECGVKGIRYMNEQKIKARCTDDDVCIEVDDNSCNKSDISYLKNQPGL